MQRMPLIIALISLLLPFSLFAKPKLAIIIDDLGYQKMPIKITNLPTQVSVAVIPFTQFDRDVAHSAHLQQREVLLHLPMQSPAGTPQEASTLKVNMDKSQLQHAVKKALYRVPQAVAVNNHMGSFFTQHQEPMQWLMAILKSEKLGFIDSRTSAKTIAQQTAKEYGIANNRRHVFLDHKLDADFIEQQLDMAIKQAKQHDIAVAIAHPSALTLRILEKELPRVQQHVELIPISKALIY